MFKGHINTGLARWAIASLLTLATCIGVVMAMTYGGYADGHNFYLRAGAGYAAGGHSRRRVCHGV
jgi:hypothetical protein